MAKTRITEGALYLHVLTENKKDATIWTKRLKQNRNFVSVKVETDPSRKYEGIPSRYKYIVTARKSRVWFSDEFPFRAGIRAFFKAKVAPD